MRQAVCYIRKSRVTSDRTLSWEVQEAAAREVAARYGDSDLLVLSDWNRSGRGEKTHLREGYRQLLSLLEADGVSALYGYSLSRLSRSLSEYVRLAELCRDHGVPIRLAKEGELDYSTVQGRFMVGILALFAQMEAELAQERARDTVAARRARGDHIGPRDYGYYAGEDPASVVAAFRAAGSMLGAARLLNLKGLPTRRGGKWSQTSVRLVLTREAPELVPPFPVRGAKAYAPHLFYRLLRCRCGRILTGRREVRPSGTYIRYFCAIGQRDPAHGRPHYVSEPQILPWVRDEMAHLRAPDDVVMGGDTEHHRAALTDRRSRIIENYEDGLIDKAQRDSRLAAVDTELERLDMAGRALRSGPIAWDRPPELVNAALRTLVEYVQLDERMRPSQAVWLVPELRAD